MKKYCIFCGEEINKESKICPKCKNKAEGKGEVLWKQPKKKLDIKKNNY